jgi:hypothetical protein
VGAMGWEMLDLREGGGGDGSCEAAGSRRGPRGLQLEARMQELQQPEGSAVATRDRQTTKGPARVLSPAPLDSGTVGGTTGGDDEDDDE